MMSLDAAFDLLVTRCPRTLTLVDVGARWGANSRWLRLGDKARIIGFEPDAVECARINESAPANCRFFPTGLAEHEGEATLHVTKEPACSSLFEPVPRLHRDYSCLAIIEPVETARIPVRRLDDVLVESGIRTMDAVKLDTQGSELSILKGTRQALRTCTLIDIEVEFNPLYTGQALFCDVDRFLRDEGFALWRFENLVHYAPEAVTAARSEFLVASDPNPPAYTTAGNGQLFWAQAQYVREDVVPTSDAWLPTERALTAALLAGVYGFWDLALHLARRMGDESFAAELSAYVGMPATTG